MRSLLLVFFWLCGFHAMSQTTVYRKIAQRHDDYINSAWQGIDSILFSYNTDGILTQQWALKGNASNWDNYSRTTFYITPTGKIGHYTRENWNVAGWLNNTRYIYTYDASDNLTLTLYEIWNGSNWQSSGKIEHAGYNAYGGWASQTTQVYSGGNWLNLSRILQTYLSGTAKVEFQTKENWNTSTSTWDKFERLFYTYFQDSIGTVIRSLPDSNNNWKSANKYIYNYTGNPLQVQSYYAQYWNQDSNKFIDTTRLLNTYNANQKVETTLTEKRVGYNNWTTLTRTLYYYNGSSQLIEKTLEEYSNAWDNKDRFLYNYNGNLVSEEIYYEGFNTTWNLHHKTIFSYDVNENLTFKQRDDYLGATYVPYSRDFYYYNTFVVGSHDLAEASVNMVVYPNPAYEKITLAMKTTPGSQLTISVYDATGRLRIIRQEPSLTEEFKTELIVNTLAAGTYFVKVTDEKNKSSVVKMQLK